MQWPLVTSLPVTCWLSAEVLLSNAMLHLMWWRIYVGGYCLVAITASCFDTVDQYPGHSYVGHTYIHGHVMHIIILYHIQYSYYVHCWVSGYDIVLSQPWGKTAESAYNGVSPSEFPYRGMCQLWENGGGGGGGGCSILSCLLLVSMETCIWLLRIGRQSQKTNFQWRVFWCRGWLCMFGIPNTCNYSG